jgi:hypothetical protein
MTDAFQAAAQAAAASTASTSTSSEIPAGKLSDVDDPFATSSEVSTGGAWTPRVPFEDIVGRMVVMVPKSFNPKAKNRFADEGETDPDKLFREEFRVDLVVLDGGSFQYEYKEADPADATKSVFKTMKVEELPFTALSQSIAQGSLIGKLKPIYEQGRLYMGVMSYLPYAKDAKKGATIDSITADVEQWIKRGRKDARPSFTWTLDDRATVLTAERRALAGAWWTEYRKSL